MISFKIASQSIILSKKKWYLVLVTMQLKEQQPIIVVQSAKQPRACGCHDNFNEWLKLAAQDLQLYFCLLAK